MSHLRQQCHPPLIDEGPPRRGTGQRAPREHERLVRLHVLDVSRQIMEQGWSWTQTSQLLHLSERTLRDWRHDLAHEQLAAHPLGRPIRAASRQQRNEVIDLLDELGPGIGLPTLRALFPELARAALADVLRRYRRLWRMLHYQTIHQLHWTAPGRVWALDFHGPRPPIDGRYPDLLAVRDLASGQQLLWLPVADATAARVVEALTILFVEHGAPLVLKSDNGSAFGAEVVQDLLATWGVKTLFSPPHMPRYNGSIEAGIGSLTTRTDLHAARQGHPGFWGWDDTEAARQEANVTARPQGEHGPSPDEAWDRRTPIRDEERQAFARTVVRLQQEEEQAQGGPPSNPREEQSKRARDRQAIRRALVEHGYLYFRRRRILPPIPRQKAADIT
jgi:hypothetical protein